jgi:hypothetical protein
MKTHAAVACYAKKPFRGNRHRHELRRSLLSVNLVAPCRHRHVNKKLALTPWRRATSATEAQGSKVSAMIRRLRSIDQRWRGPPPPRNLPAYLQ